MFLLGTMLQQKARSGFWKQNLASQAPFSKKKKRAYTPRLPLLIPPTKPTRQHQPFRQSNSSKSRITEQQQQKMDLWSIQARNTGRVLNNHSTGEGTRKQKIQSNLEQRSLSSEREMRGEGHTRWSGSERRRQRRDAKIQQAAHFVPPSLSFLNPSRALSLSLSLSPLPVDSGVCCGVRAGVVPRRKAASAQQEAGPTPSGRYRKGIETTRDRPLKRDGRRRR